MTLSLSLSRVIMIKKFKVNVVMILIHVFKDSQVFLNQYESFLSNDEVKYGLFLGIVRRNKGITHLVSSVIGKDFVLAVLAGKNLIISSNTQHKDVYKDLVIYMEQVDYPGIIGVKEICDIYHLAYQEITHKKLHIFMNQRIYQCNCVNEIKLTDGLFRQASINDTDLLVPWAFEFSKSVDEEPTLEYAKQLIDNQINNQTLYVLEINKEIVSMAARSRPLEKSESVGLVYTPPHLRGHGYATKTVFEVTKLILNDNKIATLYTDLSNPTSNKIYMDIGYRPYCDSIMLNK